MVTKRRPKQQNVTYPLLPPPFCGTLSKSWLLKIQVGPSWRDGGNSDDRIRISNSVRSEKLQNESSPNFSNFRPGFSPEFSSELSPKFSRIFRALFPSKRRPQINHQKSSPFFNTKSPAKHDKIFTILLERRQSKTVPTLRLL